MSARQNHEMEFKTVPFTLTNLDYDGRTLEGYAAFFGNTDRVQDIIHPGAFRKTLAERGQAVKFLWQHSKDEPLGRILDLKEDNRGLFVRAAISDTARGRDVLALLRDQALDALSIGYDAIPGATDYTQSKGGGTIRNLRELRLWEVSLVTFPANDQARVTALKEDKGGKPDVTENSIRWRVRDPDDFQEGSLRTIPIGAEDSGIQAVIGRLPDEESTTIQTYIFDKDKFDVDQATAWVAEHEKEPAKGPEKEPAKKQMVEGSLEAGGALVPTEVECECPACGHKQAGESCDFDCPECGTKMGLAVEAVEPPEGKAVDLESEVDAIRDSFNSVYATDAMPKVDEAWVEDVWDTFVVVRKSGKHYRVAYTKQPDAATIFAPPDEWVEVTQIWQDKAYSYRAVWTAAAINDLPDASFLYIESGGEKDEDGRTTPRAMRHFPYKDAEGAIDLPHLRNAIARIPQSNAPGLDDAKKKALQDKARVMLEKEQGKGAPEPDEIKAGRVLAERNARRIVAAIQALIETLEDAGIDVPGYEAEPTEPAATATEEKHQAPSVEPKPEQAGTDGATEERTEPPTSEQKAAINDQLLRLQADQLTTELELLEV